MKRTLIRDLGLGLGVSLAISALMAMPLVSADSSSSTTLSTADKSRIQTIISRGDSEINRRLTTLSTLSSKINSATKLTSSDKTALLNEVSSEQSGLQALETNLNQVQTVADAVADAQSIITGYRVYLLVVPQVNIVKTADDQQQTESKLSTLATGLTTRLAGNTNTSLQNDLTDMNSKIASAQGLSSSVETTVIGLTPATYTSGELDTYRDQLKTAHSDNQDALTDAKNIMAALKNS